MSIIFAPDCRLSLHGGRKLLDMENRTYYGKFALYLANLFVIVRLLIYFQNHFQFSAFYFIYVHVGSTTIPHCSILKFQALNFNTAHFLIQYCTLFIQYCTKCAILHTKISPEFCIRFSWVHRR